MDATTVTLPDLAATHRLAARCASMLRPGDAVLLDGPLGAGKSEFARALLRALAGDPALEVPSPSFTLVQGYALPGGPAGSAAHHLDLYRLAGPDEMAELGWEEAREGIVLVEWPDRLGPLRPADALAITLAPLPADPDARLATLSGWPDRLPALLDAPAASGTSGGTSGGTPGAARSA
ncbi:tRNA (adenosine(37)-N6)-threonylcarbamoyltransferase complex ATPase subunit type 1 TsaE [Roseomonas sp. NAR14]|uniref:tRNA threonylcarbamoyladenosine biosynthesis protein TsaE n=1 Tax=Roseomonas acroporae TaxID=2937791 RepID=A0A9X1YB60_9PROT|nr:tRNA (adenosine(37)-N6)-threonylcarbamoyltransferase complex ATPase subunit type 1 TsaE [Roseomonas acroporae]MCK8786475.1 tRNA (adenosine(37)-N6)-threonylcarbamoyltransferase complex ATPase subunit type 1 TsaE [Roseomonas acroporae]